MGFVKKIKNNLGTIGIWKFDESSEELATRISLNPEEQLKYKNLKVEKRKKEFLALRILLQELLMAKCEVYYGKYGNPQLKNYNLHLSISHSDELLTVFITSVKGGIDTENTLRNTEKIKTRYLSEKEIKDTENNQNPALTRIVYWSAKEAIYKCALQPSVEFKNQIKIESFNLKSKGNFRGSLKTSSENIIFNLSYFFLENNVVVYAVEK
jgi:4'-phosphopantetheinyl transferase EntD